MGGTVRVQRDIVVIGASAGGVEAVRRVVAGLPADLPAAVFVVVHVMAGATSYLPSILERAGPLRARHPQPGERAAHGTIYVAPPDHHMLLEDERILLVRGPRENRARPAINPLFRSAAVSAGPRVVGVVLTGLLDDGAAGLWAVKQRGGVAIVQQPRDALFPEMPQTALESVEVDHCLPLTKIPAVIAGLAIAPHEVIAPGPVPDFLRISNEGMKMVPRPIVADQPGRRTALTCPDCGGELWEIDGEGPPQFHCHVGHTFTARGLLAAQSASLEASLWTAVRALKESALMHEKLAERTGGHGLDKAAAAYREQALEKKRDAANLMELLKKLTNGADELPPTSEEI